MEKELFDFFMWFRTNGEKYVCSPIEHMIKIYLIEIKKDKE
jgi:hypothetical protein